MKYLKIAIRFTLLMTLLLGVAYPLLVTVLAQTVWRDNANGQLIVRDGQVIGSSLIGQSFNAPQYFHGRPSAVNYDAGTSGGSNLGPTSQKLIERIEADMRRLQGKRPDTPVPVELVTTSASGLDPHLSPAAIEFQLPRVARTRNIGENEIRRLIAAHTEPRTFGLFGEPRVNVLRLNLALDELKR